MNGPVPLLQDLKEQDSIYEASRCIRFYEWSRERTLEEAIDGLPRLLHLDNMLVWNTREWLKNLPATEHELFWKARHKSAHPVACGLLGEALTLAEEEILRRAREFEENVLGGVQSYHLYEYNLAGSAPPVALVRDIAIPVFNSFFGKKHKGSKTQLMEWRSEYGRWSVRTRIEVKSTWGVPGIDIDHVIELSEGVRSEEAVRVFSSPSARAFTDSIAALYRSPSHGRTSLTHWMGIGQYKYPLRSEDTIDVVAGQLLSQMKVFYGGCDSFLKDVC